MNPKDPTQPLQQTFVSLIHESQIPSGEIKPTHLAATPIQASGDIYYSDGSKFVRLPAGANGSVAIISSGLPSYLAPGTNGQVITIAAGAPTYATPAATPSLTSHAGSFTRDIAGTAGDVAYTGVGFIPTAIMFSYMTTDGKCVGTGFVDSAKNMTSYFSAQASGYVTGASLSTRCVYLSNGSGTDQTALLKTFDADGFTLTWAKTSTPTGTGNISYIAFK